MVTNKRRVLVIGLIFGLLCALFSFPVAAAEVVEVAPVQVDLPLKMRTVEGGGDVERGGLRTFSLAPVTYTDTFEAYIEIDADGTVSVTDTMPIQPASSSTQTEQTIMWKATCTVTYTLSGGTCVMTKASGGWTQLRGDTSITSRHVYYGASSRNYANSADKYPTTNSFSYDTGFSSMELGYYAIMGCNSTITYSHNNGSLKGSLFCNCVVEPW